MNTSWQHGDVPRRGRSRTPASPKTPSKRKRGGSSGLSSPDSRVGQNQSHKVRLDCLRRYTDWKIAGSKNEDSPIKALMKEYGVAQHFAKRQFEKMMEYGSILDRITGNVGRPATYGDEEWDEMAKIRRRYRKLHRAPSCRDISSELNRVATEKTAGSRRAQKKKKKGCRASLLRIARCARVLSMIH